DVPRTLAGRTVDEERTTPHDAEPDRVVLLDVPRVVERHAEVAAREVHHRGPEVTVGAKPDLVHDEPRPELGELRRRELTERRVVTRDRTNQVARRRQRRQLRFCALDEVALVTISHERAAKLALVEGTHEAVRALDARWLWTSDD